MSTAVHLANKNFDVEFLDLEDKAQFDLLVSKDGIKIEIDCKTVSSDIGRPIHRQRAIDLCHRIEPALERALDKKSGSFFRIVLADRLSGDQAIATAIHDLIIEASQLRRNVSKPELVDIFFSEFDIDGPPFDQARNPTQEQIAELVRNLGGPANANAISVHRPAHSAAVAVLESRRQDKMLDGIYRSLKQSAKNQFSTKNPAVLVVRPTELSGEQLVELQHGPNGLAAIANRLFAGQGREHLLEIAYVAPNRSPQRVSAGFNTGNFMYVDPGTTLSYRNSAHFLANDVRFTTFRTLN
jgi:hypothetical protein